MHDSGLSFPNLLNKSADALCRIWDKDHFKRITQDLWEERYCFPDLKDNFTYSLAVCARGLECAYEMQPNEKWLETSRQMKKTLKSSKGDYFHRSFGRINDMRIDASLLGLHWPAGMSDKRMNKTIRLIEKYLSSGCKMHRYENDDYDGWMAGHYHRKKGAGYWPLLNFWMAIYYSEKDQHKAMKYYNQVVNDVKLDIPEQIFNNSIQQSVSPLLWSHSMFVIASQKLGLIL